ncbi:hypothetical protein VTL71DRAFT_5196 [Oculimacula yallundae]|uniref:Uncharacterized protein n=1 Tax=Oculimacula yallundae TaxID=86028 RepID=A0ABR4C1X9_9HELO
MAPPPAKRLKATILSNPAPYLLDITSKIIHLPGSDPSVFVLFATWLTRGSIENCKELEDLDNSSSRKSNAKEHEKETAVLKTARLLQWHQLVHACILGDLLGSTAFKNTVIDLLVDKAQVIAKENRGAAEIYNNSLSLIYDSTEPGSPLRRLAIQLGLNHLDLSELPAGVACEFWAELAKSSVPLFRISESGHDVSTDPWSITMKKCLFHEG